MRAARAHGGDSGRLRRDRPLPARRVQEGFLWMTRSFAKIKNNDEADAATENNREEIKPWRSSEACVSRQGSLLG